MATLKKGIKDLPKELLFLEGTNEHDIKKRQEYAHQIATAGSQRLILGFQLFKKFLDNDFELDIIAISEVVPHMLQDGFELTLKSIIISNRTITKKFLQQKLNHSLLKTFEEAVSINSEIEVQVPRIREIIKSIDREYGTSVDYRYIFRSNVQTNISWIKDWFINSIHEKELYNFLEKNRAEIRKKMGF